MNPLAAAKEWFGQAIEAYDRLLEEAGEAMKADLLAERAFCAAKLGLDDQALSNVAEALEARPDNLAYLRAAARVHAIVGNQVRAYEYLRRAVKAGYPASSEFTRLPLYPRNRCLSPPPPLRHPSFFKTMVGSIVNVSLPPSRVSTSLYLQHVSSLSMYLKLMSWTKHNIRWLQKTA